MGSPKAELKIGMDTFLGRILNAIRDAAVLRSAIAVAHGEGINIEASTLQGAVILRNARPRSEGQISSIRCAIDFVINRPVEALLVWPVDHPAVTRRTVRQLLERYLRTRRPIVVPVHSGRRGHPVIFSRVVFGELLAAFPGEGANVVVRRLPQRVLEVPVNDPGVLEDIDTPADYQALLHRINSDGEPN